MDTNNQRQFASRISGGNSATGRRAGDFYPTPPEVTVALLNYLNMPHHSIVWECACGTGDMARVIKEAGYETISSDIANTGYGIPGADFLTYEPGEFDWIITNPPFSIAEKFILRAWDSGKPFAFLLKAQFWNAARRIPLFEDCPPSHVLPLTWRPDFTGAGGALMDMTWVVWRYGTGERTNFNILKKPELNTKKEREYAKYNPVF